MTSDASEGQVVTLVAYDLSWPAQFRDAATRLREAVGGWATRIDHVGSTAVPGLLAKPVLDIQLSTADPADVDDSSHPVHGRLYERGFVLDPHNGDRRKRFFRHRGGPMPVNLHVRRDGCVSQQQALLFRDYLRVDEAARQRYGAEKKRLAQRPWRSVDAYAEAKSQVVWGLLQQADLWSWWGWQPGAPDA